MLFMLTDRREKRRSWAFGLGLVPNISKITIPKAKDQRPTLFPSSLSVNGVGPEIAHQAPRVVHSFSFCGPSFAGRIVHSSCVENFRQSSRPKGFRSGRLMPLEQLGRLRKTLCRLQYVG